MTDDNHPAAGIDRDLEMRLFLVVQDDVPASETWLASAAARATWLTLDGARASDPERAGAYEVQAQPKIALRARNIGALTRARDEAAAAGLPHALVATGDGGPMVLGIGPASRAELPKFVSKMQLLPHDRADGQLPAGQPLPGRDAMWILVRRDLGMGRGKLVAQSGHGCWSAGDGRAGDGPRQDRPLGSCRTRGRRALAGWPRKDGRGS